MLWWQYPEWFELLVLLRDHAGYPPAEYAEWRGGLAEAAAWSAAPWPHWRTEALAWGVPAGAWDPNWFILVRLAENN
jgi:hypothetical protein